MKAGDIVSTPRFCNVTIEEVFDTKLELLAAGYTEPTYYKGTEYDVRGKSLDEYHMQFAAARRKEDE